MAKLPKRPRDTAQLAKFMVEMATGKRPKDGLGPADNAAVNRGSARAKALSPRKTQRHREEDHARAVEGKR